MTGEELKNYRLSKELTQEQLGRLIGYEGRNAALMIQCWEHERRPISPKKYKALAEALDIPLDKLIV